MPIEPVTRTLGLSPADWRPCGREIAKIELAVTNGPRRRPGPARLVLVSGMTPTAAGEGKTTTVIGLGQGLARLGQSVCLALRQPSLGPCLGGKGGAAGGGRSSLVPAEKIDLHFTGDFHAVTSAHNLLASLVDHHLHHRTSPTLDPRRITWRRVIDLDDRALRHVVTGLGGPGDGVPRETGFEITAASEVMAILCLARDGDDLKQRLARIVVGFDPDGNAVTAKDVRAAGAMAALLEDALLPNLVQTVDGVPAIVHGGPFANIAHGCSSVIATRTALNLADWAITEAGFGFDLGGEKFYDIKCRQAGLDTAAVVLVATVRALAAAGKNRVEAGLPNLAKHVESVRLFGESPIVALNRFPSDTEAHVDVVRRWCEAEGLPFAVTEHFSRGGDGATALAERVIANAEPQPKPFLPLYPLDLLPVEKIRTIARTMYGARDVQIAPEATRDLATAKRLGLDRLPVCMAKTHLSLTDDPKVHGRPDGFDLHVRRVEIAAGAGFLVALCGEIQRMPGLPERPLAWDLDLVDGKVVGLR